ncbi:carbohydrate-binding module family 50 protein, partial [Polychaeton citri CBS 116435]
CAAALIGHIACHGWISRFRSGGYYDPEGLQAVCTSSCASSLQSYVSALDSNCQGLTYVHTEMAVFPISSIGSRLLYNYQSACLKDDDRFCNYVAYDHSLQLDPGAQPVLGPGTNKTLSHCDKCFVKQLQLRAGSPFDGGNELITLYNSLTSSCRVTGMPVSTTPLSSSRLSTYTSLTSSPARTCSSRKYHVHPDDTVRSIAKSQGISVGWLVIDNNLSAYGAHFSANGSLCIQNTCTLYTVRSNDTCILIARAHKVTMAQLLSWNPILDPTCSNLALSVGDTICVSKPGAAYVTPSSALPSASSSPGVAPVPTDLAEGTNRNCSLYYRVAPGDYCNLLSLKYKISLDDFIFLNPSINANCTNLFANESYCVQPLGRLDNYPGHPGYVPPSPSITSVPYASFPTATFVMPEIDVPTPSPLAPGTRGGCTIYLNGADMNASAVGTFFQSQCEIYARSYQITLGELQNW